MKPAKSPKPSTSAHPSGKRLTDEQKAEIVREADDEGTEATARRLGINPGNIYRWRKDGFGSKAKAKPSSANYNDQPKAAPANGPAVRCPVCHKGCPVVDPSDNAEKRKVLGAHFVESPDCKETMRRRG